MNKKRISALLLLSAMLTTSVTTTFVSTSNILHAEEDEGFSKYLIKDSELPEKEDDNEVISLPDYNLRKQICALYGYKGKYKDFENAKLTKRDLRRIWYLSPEVCQAHDNTEKGVKVRKLEGLEHAENLEYLSLVNQLVEDLTPISNLTKIKTIKLKGTRVTDFAPLANLVNLEDADLSGLHPKSTAPLKNLVNMKKIELICEDLDFVTNMVKLEILVADHSTVSDLSPLVNLKNLKELRIDGKVRNYISPEGARVKDISVLTKLNKLEFLSISNHEIEDISTVADMRNLVTFHATDNKIKNFESLLSLPNLAEVWVQNNDNNIELPTTNKYITAKKLYDKINKDELTKEDVATIDEILNDSVSNKFFSEDTLKKLAEYKETLASNDKVENKLFEDVRAKYKNAKIVSVDEIPTIKVKKGSNVIGSLPALVKVQVEELKNKEIKGQFLKYTDGQELKIAVVDKDGKLVEDGTTFTITINHGVSEHSKVTTKDGYVTLKARSFAGQYIPYSFVYGDQEIFEFEKLTITKFKDFKVGGKTYDFETTPHNDIEKALVIRLGEKAPEPTPVEKYDVTYKFVSKDASKDLPEEVTSKLPAAEKVEKGQNVTLKAFNNIEVKDGTWSFEGWNSKETTITANTEYVGTWKFTQKQEEVNDSNVGVFLVGNRYKIRYKVVDTEGNEIKTPNFLTIIKKNSSAYPENMVLTDKGLYEFENHGMLGNYELELNTKEYRLKDTYGFGIKYNKEANRGEFSYILSGPDKKPLESTNEKDFTLVVEKVKEDNFEADSRLGLKTEKGKQVVYFKVVNQKGEEVREYGLLRAYGKDTGLANVLKLQENGTYSIQMSGEDQNFDIESTNANFVLEDSVSYYDAYNPKTFKGSLKYINKNNERFNVTEDNAENIPVKFFIIRVNDKSIHLAAITNAEKSSNTIVRSARRARSVDNVVLTKVDEEVGTTFERNLPVEWDLSNYKDEVGEYTLTGKIILDGNTENPDNLVATVKVKVVDENEVENVNKDALQKAVETAKAPQTTKDKTEESVKTLNEILAKAEEVLANKEATQDEVNSVEKELTEAIKALKDKEVEPENPVDPEEPVNPEKPQADKWVQNDDGTWTYQLADGKVAVKDSWKLINDEWYRFDKDGKMVSNQWFEENGRWYYIEPNGTMSKNEWIIINGEWYYANADGRISQNEWVLVDGNWYYANASGRIADSEWFVVGGKWYYAEKGGLIAQGKTLKINNVNYTFDSNGVLVK